MMRIIQSEVLNWSKRKSARPKKWKEKNNEIPKYRKLWEKYGPIYPKWIPATFHASWPSQNMWQIWLQSSSPTRAQNLSPGSARSSSSTLTRDSSPTLEYSCGNIPEQLIELESCMTTELEFCKFVPGQHIPKGIFPDKSIKTRAL